MSDDLGGLIKVVLRDCEQFRDDTVSADVQTGAAIADAAAAILKR